MFTSPPVLRILPAPDYWEVVQALTWDGPEGHFTIPAGFVTDLASIPRLLRNLPAFDVCGLNRLAAIGHDWHYCEQRVTRAQADEFLRRALISSGVMPALARVYWAAVRAGGWVPWSRRLQRGGGIQPDDFASSDAYVQYRASSDVPASAKLTAQL